jgi:catechol 2,3-dioxygenase-like lactoylglutathione lyase family enzyme
MKAMLKHLQLNVSDFARSSSFYKDLLGYFGYKVISEGGDYLGLHGEGVDFWIMAVDPAHTSAPFHRKHAGLNHLAFSVTSKEDVDRFHTEFLTAKNIPTLYETPKAFPEYTPDYYAVFFEDPGRLKLEVTFHS